MEQIRRNSKAAIPGSSYYEEYKNFDAQLAEIERKINQAPKTLYLSPRTKDTELKAYYQGFTQRVLKAANERLSEISGKSNRGHILISVTLRKTGELESIEILKSTNSELSQALQQLIAKLAPYEPLPDRPKTEADHIILFVGFDHMKK